MLSLLVSGLPCNDIDVYLEPSIDDIQVLLDQGVETYDAYVEKKFTLRLVVSWTINDYPSLGVLRGCPYSKYKGYIVFRKNTHSIRVPKSKK